eukprot:maker-scaffold541_size141817-snap-gene-0.26 protein:Tk05600 transcript:maker-scaffold541_size141817-snap-gene-0.26-mRNA-1 annotation:"membrane protein"
MSLVQALARAKFMKRNDDRENEGRGSPVKTVMGALTPRPKFPDPIRGGKKSSKLTPVAPTKIEDVPFRRQDRRIVNARKRRTMDRQLIKCLCFFGIVAVLAGVAFIVMWFQYKEQERLVDPFVIIGTCVVIFGLILILCTIEVCIKLQKNVKRVRDPEIDNVKSLHLIKHWIQPELIPYGWGQELDGKLDAHDHPDDSLLFQHDKAALASSRGGVGFRPGSAASLQGYNVVHPSSGADFMDESNPHMAMAIEMSQVRSHSAGITSDIFDESLRYSNIDRPKLQIDRSSPTLAKQWRGEFITEEERISNLFSPMKRTH